MNWMPIESAPRENVTILGYEAGMWPITYHSESSQWVLSGVSWVDGSFIVYPTHWMPLPEPPK